MNIGVSLIEHFFVVILVTPMYQIRHHTTEVVVTKLPVVILDLLLDQAVFCDDISTFSKSCPRFASEMLQRPSEEACCRQHPQLRPQLMLQHFD
jgi:hypothetical protein